VTGIGITLLASSLTYYSYRVLFPKVTSPPRISPFEPLAIPLLSDIPVVGEILIRQTPLTYFAFILVGIAAAYVLYPHAPGWRCARWQNPAAVEAQASMSPLRIGAVMVGSALMAVGARFHDVGVQRLLLPDGEQARLDLIARWCSGPGGRAALLGALLFGLFDAYQLRLQQVASDWPYQLFLMLPYILSIIALIVMSRRAAYPRALMVPYRKGER
jgi:simple sugar transport system permease protein